MNRRDPLILVDDPKLVSSGLWPDRHPAQTPLWEIAENTQFAGGKVQRRVPNSIIPIHGVGNPANTANTPRGIGQLQASNGVRWLYFTEASSIYRWYGPAAEVIYPLPNFVYNQTATQRPTFFDFTPWGNWMIVNSEENGAQVFKPGSPNTFQNLSALGDFGAPMDAVAYFKKRNQLIAVGHGVNRRLVSFSDADQIDRWVTSTTNLAGTIPLEELATPVRAACHFGPSIAVFGENQMFEFKWIGAPFYYTQQKLLDGIGCIGKVACCSDGRIVYGFGRNGAWKTDGMQYSYIDEVVLRDYLQENINWAQSAKIAVAKNDLTGCIEFSFPMGTSIQPNEAWSYDPRYGGWSKVPPFALMSPRILFDKPIQATLNPDTTGFYTLVNDNPALASPMLLETKGMLIQRDNQALHVGALIDEIELFMHGADKVEMQYGVAEFPEGPFTWSNPFDVTTEQITYKVELNISGTYHKLRFKSYETNWALDLQGFALFGVAEGLKREKL